MIKKTSNKQQNHSNIKNHFDQTLKMITIEKLLLLLIFYSGIALIFAYISQYFFGHQPCQLCIYQRFAFIATIITAILGIFLANNKFGRIFFYFAIITIAGNIIIASYHSGVEAGIFKGLSSCNSQIDINQISNASDLAEEIRKVDQIDCRKPTFIFLKLSMANWNAIYCLILLMITCILYKKLK